VGRLLPEDPRHIAGFEVVGRLGQGGMGVVYLADHAEMGSAALKFVHPASAADATFRERFRREVEAANRVRSPRVAPVLAADPDAATPWLATAFVDGPTLGDAVEERGPMEGERLVALAVALADALAAIHRAEVVHRDLKPGNILLTPETPIVIDFGIAALREAPALTRMGSMLGTPGWMAPEQIRGGRIGPRVDVFAWGLVVAYAACGNPPFGTGPADALYYRIVHEAPQLPALPDPLDRLVRSALAKDARVRPDASDLVEALTAGPPDVPTGTTVAGPTLADRTEVVPTIVAQGWGVDALPARPNGRSAPAGAADAAAAAGAAAAGVAGAAADPAEPAGPDAGLAPGAGAAAAAGPGAGPVPGAEAPPVGARAAGPIPGAGAEPATRRAAGTPTGPPFWFAGGEHHDERSLAAAFQASWDEAADQLFRRRDPVWMGELQAFLRARKLDEADRIVTAGGGDAPVAATMARLLLALEPGLEPRVGPIRLTQDGLAAAAQAVVDGRDDGARLAEIRDAHVLRLWRLLPGMERAAWIDERWLSSIEAFGRLAATVSPQAGWPTAAERNQASAALLLCAVHPDHERRLGRRLAAAKRTAARHQPWWAQLAAEGPHSPAAAVLAVMTAERARNLAQGAKDAARDVAKAQREAERRLREAERVERQRREAAEAAARPPEWRYRPLPRAQSGVRRTWVLVVVLGGLVLFLWMLQRFGHSLVDHYETVLSDGIASDDGSKESRLQAYRSLDGYGVVAALLLVLLPAAHVATRMIVRDGARKPVVRVYAGVAAALDLLLGLTFVAAATIAGFVFGAGIEGRVRSDIPDPFGNDPWTSVVLLFPFGLVGVVLVVRSAWRLARVVFGGLVTGPALPAQPRRARRPAW
jgi:predicted Ser/Thr protein kinase